MRKWRDHAIIQNFQQELRDAGKPPSHKGGYDDMLVLRMRVERFTWKKGPGDSP
jgi:hypothetical protein